MHWFWRGLISVVIAALITNLFVLVMNTWGGFRAFAKWDTWYDIPGCITGTLIHSFAAINCIGIYAYLTVRFPPKKEANNETRCRKCGYILRGITEPRCSECGEKI